MTTHQVSLTARPTPRPRPTATRPGELIVVAPDRAEPWQRRHVLGTLALAVIGVVGMVVCWYGGAGKLTYDDQVPWLVGSIFSAGVVVLGGVYWLVCAFRQVTLMERDLARYLGPWLAEARASLEHPALAREVGDLVVGAGMTRAHRTDCVLARGKSDLMPVTAAEMAQRGLRGCGACGA